MSPFARSISVAAMLFVGSVALGATDATDGAPGQAPDQSERDHSKPRELTYEEAHELLTAFLKVSPLAVEQSGDMGYKGFYFFMADMGSLPCRPCARQGQKGVYVGSFQYYAVDRRTGDVWNSTICQRIAARALTRLQAALRKRIGLTNPEYDGLRRDGPLCEPGMPRAPAGKTVGNRRIGKPGKPGQPELWGNIERETGRETGTA